MANEERDAKRVEELQAARVERLQAATQNPRAPESGTFEGDDREHRPRARNAAQELGLHAIDQYEAKGGLRSDAADVLDDLGRLESKYLSAVANPDYNTAFGKLLADPQSGHLRMSPQETDAVRVVNEVMHDARHDDRHRRGRRVCGAVHARPDDHVDVER